MVFEQVGSITSSDFGTPNEYVSFDVFAYCAFQYRNGL